jgi:hypothetical protein
MRVFTALCASLVLSVMAFGQMPGRGPSHSYIYEPYVPMVTTPELSLQTISPSPVGASNATYGLVAGARNSTLSMINGNTSSNYTEAVWYTGGDAPLMSAPEISLEPRALHGGHVRMPHPEEFRREHGEEAPRQWTYFAAAEETSNAVEAATAAKSGKKATRSITNQDVENENQKNGLVKYDSKTEKIQ